MVMVFTLILIYSNIILISVLQKERMWQKKKCHCFAKQKNIKLMTVKIRKSVIPFMKCL